MNTAVLHKKVLGMPVWAVGIGGATAVVIFRHFHSAGIGGAQAATTPATGTGDATTGDPVPVDAGTFPQTFPAGSGSGGGGGSGGIDAGAFSDALGGLADAIMNQPQPADYSQQFADLNAGLGAIRDQQATDHAQAADTHAAAQTHAKTTAHKAATVHAKAQASSGKPVVSHGGRVDPPKPATHRNPAPPHPKTPAATHAKPAKAAATKRNAK